MATPVVSGSFALLLEKYPFYTNKDIKMKLRKNCDKLKTPRHHQLGADQSKEINGSLINLYP